MGSAKQRRAALHASMSRKAQLFVKKIEAGTIVPPDLSSYDDDGTEAALDALLARLSPDDEPAAPVFITFLPSPE